MKSVARCGWVVLAMATAACGASESKRRASDGSDGGSDSGPAGGGGARATGGSSSGGGGAGGAGGGAGGAGGAGTGAAAGAGGEQADAAAGGAGQTPDASVFDGSSGGTDAGPDVADAGSDVAADVAADVAVDAASQDTGPVVCTPPGSSIVVVPGFRVDELAVVTQPLALAQAPARSVFPPGTYVASLGPSGASDEIVRIDPSGNVSTFATLQAAADPAGLAFGLPSTPFADKLIVSANNLGGTLADGAILLVDENGVASTLSAIGRPNGPQEPSGIALPTDPAFGAGILVANACSDQGNVVRIDSAGALTAFYDSNVDGCPTGSEPGVGDVAFGPGGAWGTGLYVADYNDCRCVRSISSAAVLSAPIGPDQGAAPRGLAFAPGGVWGTDLYIALADGRITRLGNAGATTAFASGFASIGSSGTLLFVDGGTTLHVSDFDAGRVYAVVPDARCLGAEP